MEKIYKTARLRPLLEECFLFKGANKELIAFALSDDGCEYAAFSAGEAVYTRDLFRCSLGLVASGTLRSVKQSPGGSQIVLRSFNSGDIFGAAALFNTHDTYVSHITSLNRSRVVFFSQELLHKLFEKDVRVAENYITCLSERICYLNEKIDSFTGGQAEARLARYLVELCCQEDSQNFELPCSLTVLSKTLDIGRASLYRAFDTLASQQCIRRAGRNIEILDFQRLCDFKA